ncbi:Peroxyureidoacrylate/ureidoacrylate amidohydrolase [Lachnellula hyalina]|uniref:Peroxyureidoacrylate/ureidoacrylate amidohydrolase n=1 Tax=Lachnellula hyalina TaxID=1316788 RepID=A0A8H8QYT4_9HELO|nr:Peroxyureidoacrylate/ureidoacrylate amidohydrolase [Lachnellula hyalina]TVY25244.1 Peroxyureidoacrylate/ureidoacrylate amidohydrolase [Lachnellula hyalina]
MSNKEIPSTSQENNPTYYHQQHPFSSPTMAETAFLVMDVQAGIVSRMAAPPNYLQNLQKTITAARAHPSTKVIYITVAFRPGHPEVSASNPIFGPIVSANLFVSGSSETQIEAAIAPVEGDILVEKKRVSAFTGSGLDVVLRGLGVEKLVLAGISTSGVVLATVVEAFDRDFGITVLKDLCVDEEPVHEVLMEQVFKKRGQVLNADEWLEKLKV